MHGQYDQTLLTIVNHYYHDFDQPLSIEINDSWRLGHCTATVWAMLETPRSESPQKEEWQHKLQHWATWSAFVIIITTCCVSVGHSIFAYSFLAITLVYIRYERCAVNFGTNIFHVLSLLLTHWIISSCFSSALLLAHAPIQTTHGTWRHRIVNMLFFKIIAPFVMVIKIY